MKRNFFSRLQKQRMIIRRQRITRWQLFVQQRLIVQGLNTLLVITQRPNIPFLFTNSIVLFT